MRIYVAGHNGLVGSAIVRNFPKNFELITVERNLLDLTNHKKVEEFLLESKPDAVILCAAKVGGIGANSKLQRSFLSENLEIQHSVINGAANAEVPNLIFLGSSCIYPKLAEQPISESSLLTGPLEPTNEGYALAKITGVRLCRAISEELGLNYFSLMPTNMYGPNDNFDYESSHVPAAMIRKFHEAKSYGLNNVEVWGSGLPLREFMHSDDLALACFKMLEGNYPGQLFNVGTGCEISISDFAKTVAKVVGFNGTIKFDRSKPDGTPRKLLDSSKLNAVGWIQTIGLEQGLESTYKWFLKALEKGEVRGIKA